ncbi:hypothetical protein EDD86DRAFT_77903 [Gorgonomyces haynaldii]|nr:hypothetical protein EDD86DRAFT_77903 [Gorgonomyces haynaldii]
MTFVLPGQTLELEDVSRLGPGLLEINNDILCTKTGILRNAGAGRYYVDSHQKRYIPSLNEPVIGIVTGKAGENYKVDIKSAHSAYLSFFAFEGATKRNKPNLQNQSIVFARVSVAHPDMEPEIECMGTTGFSMGFGELKDGFLIQISLELSRTLFDSKHPILQAFSSTFPFEMAVGMNGLVWINAQSPRDIIALSNCIKEADGYPQKHLQSLTLRHLKQYKSQMDTA